MANARPKRASHLVLPLIEHRGRARNDNPVDAPAQQQFAGYEARALYCLAKSDIVRNEEIDPWQSKSLVQWVELVGVDTDACAEGGLEEAWVGCRHGSSTTASGDRRQTTQARRIPCRPLRTSRHPRSRGRRVRVPTTLTAVRLAHRPSRQDRSTSDASPCNRDGVTFSIR